VPDETIRLLVELVRKRSVTPDDAGCQQLIAARLTEAGFRCESMIFGDVTNLWARFGSTGPVLCFAGHTDVVPPGNADEWETDPFEPNVKDDMLFGRGAADMKSGLAAMIVAAEQFVAANTDPKGSLAFLVTSDEEGNAIDGTQRVIETLSARDEEIKWCVIGEPSSDKRLGDVIRIGRRGSLNGKLIVKGTQGHVAYPEFVANPIRAFTPALAELQGTEWDKGNEHFPSTSFQVVHVESGLGVYNVTPAILTALFNFRYSTEWDHRELKDQFESVLDRHGLDYELEWHLSGEPFLTSDGALINAAVSAISEQTGVAPILSTGGGTSDGRFIAPAGADVIEVGPVNASIHKVNEHVRVSDVPRLASIYRRIMELLLI